MVQDALVEGAERGFFFQCATWYIRCAIWIGFFPLIVSCILPQLSSGHALSLDSY